MLLVSVKPSRRKTSKFVATFMDRDRQLRVHFGDSDKLDFVDHLDKAMRLLYYQQNWKKLQSFDLTSREYLEWFILNDSDSIQRNTRRYQGMLLKLGKRKRYALAPQMLLELGITSYKRKLRAVSMPISVSFSRGKKME